MTERDFNEKLFTIREDLRSSAIEYGIYSDARKAMIDGRKVTIHVDGIVINVSQDLVHMCTAIVNCKQGKLLDLIQKKCAEMDRIIEEYKKVQEEGTAE